MTFKRTIIYFCCCYRIFGKQSKNTLLLHVVQYLKQSTRLMTFLFLQSLFSIFLYSVIIFGCIRFGYTRPVCVTR